jgi:hypothetical protein
MRGADPGVPLLPQIMCSREFISSIGREMCIAPVELSNATQHPKQDPIYVFPEMKQRGVVTSFHIRVTVTDLYIPTTGAPILLQV